MSRIRFPGYARMSYGFEQLAGNGSQILIDTNSFDPPSGWRKNERYIFEDMGIFYEAFESTLRFFGFTLADRAECIETINGVRNTASAYKELLRYMIATNPRVQITVGVENEMQRAVGYMERNIHIMGKMRRPRGVDPEVWKMLKDFAKEQHDYFLSMVDGDFSPLDVLKRRGLLVARDTAIHEYLLRNRERYEVKGETKGVDEEIVAVAISNSVRGKKTKILSYDHGLADEVKGFYFDCIAGNQVDGIESRNLGTALSTSEASMSVNAIGIMGDMRVYQDTHVLYKHGFVEPHQMGDFDKACREGWKPPSREAVEKALKTREDISLDF